MGYAYNCYINNGATHKHFNYLHLFTLTMFPCVVKQDPVDLMWVYNLNEVTGLSYTAIKQEETANLTYIQSELFSISFHSLYIHTHTHTHIYIYIYMCLFIYSSSLHDQFLL